MLHQNLINQYSVFFIIIFKLFFNFTFDSFNVCLLAKTHSDRNKYIYKKKISHRIHLGTLMIDLIFTSIFQFQENIL